MVISYLVDSDWSIDVLNGYPLATERLIELAPRGLAISLITYGELFQGAYYGRDQQAALGILSTYLDGKELLPLTPAIMERFAIVRGQLTRPVRQQLGDMDLLIAATALTHDLTLVTRNLRDFRLVPGLALHEVEPAP